jgi:hypothetical protein
VSIRLVLVLAGIAAVWRPLEAQHSGVAGPAMSRLDLMVQVSDTATRQHASYAWRQPALMSGAVLGSLAGLFSIAFCGDFDSNNTTPLDQCPAQDGVDFLIGAVVGGTIAGVITASPRLPAVPEGYERSGNHGLRGALTLGVPSAGILALSLGRPCRRTTFFSGSANSTGCSIGSIGGGLAMVAVNAAVGYLVGKGIPAFRRISSPPVD